MTELTAFLMVGNSNPDRLELRRAGVVLKSLNHFWVGDAPLRVVVGHHDSLTDHIEELTISEYSNLAVSSVSDTEMLGSAAMKIVAGAGWYRQQLIRILFTEKISTGPVLLLDADTFAASYFSTETFIQNGKILSAWEARSNKGWWQQSERLFNTQGRNNYYGLLNTPNVVSGELFAKVNQLFTVEFGDVLGFLNGVLSLNKVNGENPFTEYTYYNLIAEKTGDFFNHHVEPDEGRLQYTDKNVWSEEDFQVYLKNRDAVTTPFRVIHGGLSYTEQQINFSDDF